MMIKVEGWFASKNRLPRLWFPIEVIAETEKAMKVKMLDTHNKRELWIPKSVLELRTDKQ
jgi:hypothetical protein